MPTIDFISQHKQLLEQLLDGHKELRREMLAFLTTLDAVWEKMPATLPIEERVFLVRELTKKFMNEVCYGVEVMDRRFDELIISYKDAERASLFEKISNLEISLATSTDDLSKTNYDLLRTKYDLARTKEALSDAKNQLSKNKEHITEIESSLSALKYVNENFEKMQKEIVEALNVKSFFDFSAETLRKNINKILNAHFSCNEGSNL